MITKIAILLENELFLADTNETDPNLQQALVESCFEGKAKAWTEVKRIRMGTLSPDKPLNPQTVLDIPNWHTIVELITYD